MKLNRLLLAATGLALPAAADAFCGAYVGSVGASLVNRSSEVVLARDGNRTTLTLVMDYEGDAEQFALLLPIPKVLGPEDVRSIDVNLIDWIREFSNPRAVTYTCEDLFPTPQVRTPVSGCVALGGCGGYGYSDTDGSGWRDTANGVDVEDSWREYGYEFVVLDATNSIGLFTWLTTNGYAVPAGGEDILQEYIDANSYFLAAKIDLTAVERQGDWLPPIQFSYESDVFGLPLRIGTISADGEQEVVMYILSDPHTDGAFGISNYPEVVVPNDCMWGAEGSTDLQGWYGDKVRGAVDAQGAGWIQEYSWDMLATVDTSGMGGYHCDPCSPLVEPIAPTPDGSFDAYGLTGLDAHITRLRMRYRPEDAHSDVVLYPSRRIGVNEQLKYIDYNRELEFAFPSCDEGAFADPGTCPQAPAAGCHVSWPGGGGFAAMGLAVLLRRRRSS